MLPEAQKIEQSDKIKLLVSTCALAIFIVFVANVFLLLLHISENINEPTFQIIQLSFDGTYLNVNNEKVGFALIFNFIGLLLLWVMMTYHTLKTIKKPFVSMFV